MTFATVWLGHLLKRGEKEEDRLREDHRECLERVARLELRLEAVEHHHASLVPRWITNVDRRILWINGAAMMSIFGPLQKSRDEVEGHTFADVLGMEASRELDRLARSALAFPGRAVSTMLQLHQGLGPMHIVVVAGVGRDNELIYEGYAYGANDPVDVHERGSRRQEEQIGLSTLRTQNQDGPGASGAPG